MSSDGFDFFLYICNLMTMEEQNNRTDYTEDNIKSLDWSEHIRLRPGMYIGKLGD